MNKEHNMYQILNARIVITKYEMMITKHSPNQRSGLGDGLRLWRGFGVLTRLLTRDIGRESGSP